MKCHYLHNYSTAGNSWSVATCAAREHLYVPSVGDLSRLCGTISHPRCPYFLRQEGACRPVQALAKVLTEAPGALAW